MRWIVISLLIVNLLVLLWRALPDTGHATPVPVRSTVPGAVPLQLADTRDADAGTNADRATEGGQGAGTTRQADIPDRPLQNGGPQDAQSHDAGPLITSVPDATTPVAGPESPDAPASGVPATSTPETGAQQTAPKQPAVAERPATAKPGTPDTALAAQPERSAGSPAPTAGANAVPASPAPGAGTETACRASPWTSDADALDKWRGALGARLLSEVVRPLPPALSWLVYIPGKASREATLARLRELKGLKLESAFLNGGEQQGGISLGLFSKRESAERRLAEARALGVTDARLLERRRERQETRLLARAGAGVPTGWEEISCQNIAPADIAH